MTQSTIIVDIHSLSHDGRGIATVEGVTVFVDGGLPNEKVRCEIIKKHRNYKEARVLEVLVASEERTIPECAHADICGGCSMQHLQVDKQILYKQKSLLEQLQHFGKVTPKEILPPLTGESFGYRRRARLGVRYVRKKERVLVGFREKMSNYLACLDTCLVLHPNVGRHLAQLSELISTLSQFEHIPQIEVSVGDQETALVFRHMTELPTEDQAKLIAFAMTHQLSIYLQPNPPGKISKLWPKETSELLFYLLPAYELKMEFHPMDFIQINGEINQRLIQQAITLLDPQPSETVLDLFCGLGNFTLPLSRFSKKVVGVEGNQEMIERARENALNNQIKHVTFYVENLAKPDPTSPWLQQKYDKILLDPARTGAKEIIPNLIKLGAKRIVYVSCNPATLARDAGEFIKNGYQLNKVGVINMFPHTSHIEAIALFEKS